MGREIPMLEGEPELFPHLYSTWRAFNTLDRSRQFGYGHPQPILFSEMVAYVQSKNVGYVGEMIENLQFLDQIYLEHHARKAEKEMKKQRAKTSGRT